MLGLLLLVLPLGLIFVTAEGSLGCGAAAAYDIPPDYLWLYQQAGRRYGISWQVLAGIGKAESDHGRGAATGIRSEADAAGAMGPMQFLGSTWASYGVDGDGDGRRDVYDPADAIFSAARYLKANGAPDDLYRAIWHYNHADSYVRQVMVYARGYSAEVGAEFCFDAVLPTAVAGRVLAYARQQLGKPYRWGAEGPGSFDCSGLAMRAYQYAGLAIPRVTYQQWKHGTRIPVGQEQPGDLIFMRMGPAGPRHVGIVVTPGHMIHAPRTGDVVRRASYTTRSDVVGFVRSTVSGDLT
ncbi:NlpC/P60 family protein [Nonomuraea sp. NPDC046570]|uniref:C40 family peptidase n=1 Tax=Nonomuraea sp. NPDC046570 TaxID=3155255 RepID=UPI00340F5A85